MTLVVWDVRKPKRELARDLSIVIGLQLAALGYGLHTVYEARPAAVVLEGQRLRAVRKLDLADVAPSHREQVDSLAWWRVNYRATRQPRPEERFDAIQQAMAGRDLGLRPEFWLPESQAGAAMARASQPAELLLQWHPQQAQVIRKAIAATGLPGDRVGFLPILARRTDHVLLVDRRDGAVVGHAPVDGFR